MGVGQRPEQWPDQTNTDPDPRVVLPADYTFTAADAGVHTFRDTGRGETTLWTHGRQTVTATDTADGSITGGTTVKVKIPRGITALVPATPSRVVTDTTSVPAPLRSEPPRLQPEAADPVFTLFRQEGTTDFPVSLVKHGSQAEPDLKLPDLFFPGDLRWL